MKTTSRPISMLVCFAGRNQRVEINPKKCAKKDNEFIYKTQYKAADGNTYVINVASIQGSNGSRADVLVTNRSGKKVIADRKGVAVRFSRYIFE